MTGEEVHATGEAGVVDEPQSSTTPAVVEESRAVPAATSSEAAYLNLLWKMARLTTNTELVPTALRGRPDAALAVMAYGHELGLRPMTALQEVYIVEGRTSCSAKLMRSLILRAGHVLAFREVSSERCILAGTRADGRGDAVVTWTLDDAKRAGLLGKTVWQKYPRAMLAARATSELARLVFPDVTIGYTPEELSRVDLSGDYDYVDVEEVPDTVDEDGRPAHEVAGDVLDVEDELDAEWLAAARAEEVEE